MTNDSTTRKRLLLASDNRGRIALGKAGVDPSRWYEVNISPNGTIVISPAALRPIAEAR